MYIPDILHYNTNNKSSNYLYIPEDLDYNTTLYDVLTCTHMRDKFNVNNNYILTSYIGSGLFDYNTALWYLDNIFIYNIYIHTRASTFRSQQLFYKGETLFLHLFCTANIRSLMQISSKTLEFQTPKISISIKSTRNPHLQNC